MKLANLDGRAVLVLADGIADLATASAGRFGPDLASVYDSWDEVTDWLRGASLDATAPLPDPVRLGAPSPSPRQVFGIGLNYRLHAEESGAQLPPIPATFTKFPTCITGPAGAITLPSDQVDWEVELVVVIGRTATSVAAADAWSYVAGLSVGQDLSERRVQMAAGMQFSLGKSYAGFGAFGPWLVTPDEVEDPDDLGLGCSIDGEVVQSSRTSDMVFGVGALIEELSKVLTLLPGDVIFTGTPSGVGMARSPQRFLKPGEVLESWVEGVGHMRHEMVGI